jgi:hypothetical protein
MGQNSYSSRKRGNFDKFDFAGKKDFVGGEDLQVHREEGG